MWPMSSTLPERVVLKLRSLMEQKTCGHRSRQGRRCCLGRKFQWFVFCLCSVTRSFSSEESFTRGCYRLEAIPIVSRVLPNWTFPVKFDWFTKMPLQNIGGGNRQYPTFPIEMAHLIIIDFQSIKLGFWILKRLLDYIREAWPMDALISHALLILFLVHITFFFLFLFFFFANWLIQSQILFWFESKSI